VLDQWNNSPLVDISFHSETLSWFRANQYLILLLKPVCLTRNQQIPIYCLWHERNSNLLYTTLETNTQTITPSVKLLHLQSNYYTFSQTITPSVKLLHLQSNYYTFSQTITPSVRLRWIGLHSRNPMFTCFSSISLYVFHSWSWGREGVPCV
jgi:hypothetical protein